MKKINSILKIVLAIISLVVAFIQFKSGNNLYVLYWLLVATYWITNYLTGIIK